MIDPVIFASPNRRPKDEKSPETPRFSAAVPVARHSMLSAGWMTSIGARKAKDKT
ncbi:MAG: hypothetical protein L6Q75_12335 [Burkholderiaceae bacterium]|nr:hypothetical protein [Burkholderiaceae bacterium]